MDGSPPASAEERRDALVAKLFAGVAEALDLLSVYLGDRLGLYAALAEHGPLTPSELSAAAGIHERYAREWLEHEAASGILDVAEDRERPVPLLPAPAVAAPAAGGACSLLRACTILACMERGPCR